VSPENTEVCAIERMSSVFLTFTSQILYSTQNRIYIPFTFYFLHSENKSFSLILPSEIDYANIEVCFLFAFIYAFSIMLLTKKNVSRIRKKTKTKIINQKYVKNLRQ
jgi:hypothetical protein